MIIAIASTRGPKVEAVKKVVGSIAPFLQVKPAAVSYLQRAVEERVAMPRSLGELLGGARKRVADMRRILRTEGAEADFYVGLEGGFHPMRHLGKELIFLQSWAYVSDRTVGFFGSSGNVLVPDRIAHEVMVRGRDLADVIDEAAGEEDIRSRGGTWGVLTRNLLARQQSFEIALTAAFAPFYNPALYGSTAAAKAASATGATTATTTATAAIPLRIRSARQGTDRNRR